MKSNLAILSSDQKSIDFIKNNKMSNLLNLYANSSRNIEVAQIFAETHKFKKYYGSYEDLINDKDIDIILNFLPSGIKFGAGLTSTLNVFVSKISFIVS